MKGLLYVVYNEWIINPETGKMPYKIGITTKTIDERYYGLGLKMPGTFKTRFAYEFDDCNEAENLIQRLFKRGRVKGEWFEISEEQVDLVKKNCENMGGIPATIEIGKEILEEAEHGRPLTTKNLSPSEAKIICKENGVNIPEKFTLAAKNKSVNTYWANPSIGLPPIFRTAC
jgi:hypothetical protein